MKFFRHIITTAVIIGALSVGVEAFEQKKGQKPPRQPTDVARPEKQPPPPRNDNRGDKQDRDRDRDREKDDNRRGRP